ncbi:JNK1/MAPK8-associated membrane protein-like [Liolophura sinensis]|uniref:JNK1/MAPK8-associated membrane protein-like n=1 Tax=Liolophura sinensis TaxID=3198878 RepID=UPI0031584142
MPTKCPGIYCGRTAYENGSYSVCGACPRGSKPNEHSLCEACHDSPSFYDWLYLGFMAVLSLLLHWFFIDFTNKRKSRALVVLHVSAVTESVLSAIITLLLARPMGTLAVESCSVNKLSDWYTMMYNPTPNYTTTLHCTQEIVYPLYTIVMVYYAFCLIFLMLVRPVISHMFMDGRGTKSIYAALYFLPILVVIQAVFAGLLYYAFPYIVLVVSTITCAIHLAYFKEQNIKDILHDIVKSPRNLTILLGHWMLHAFGIVAVTELRDPGFHSLFIMLVPFPALFYILTVRFTDPDHLDTV